MTLRFCLAIVIGLAFAGLASADENVREVQEKLRDGNFYSGDIDGAYSSQLAAALKRYQMHKGLPVTGQLDIDTSNALGAKPAVTTDAAAPEKNSETHQRLERHEEQTSTNPRERSTPRIERSEHEVESVQSSQVTVVTTSKPGSQSANSPSLDPSISSESTKPASAPPGTVSDKGSTGDTSTEQLRNYVGAFVQAGMEPRPGLEANFFADRVRYYDEGVIGREQIRNDLQNYAARWPERHFWFAGNITIEPQRGNRVRVTFPLEYELRNGPRYASGKINKTLVLEPVGDNLQIVAVNERTPE